MTIYTRPGCHLCDEMKQIVVPVAARHQYTVQEVDISQDEQLESQFGNDIPVLFVNGRKAFKYRVTAGRLRRRLMFGF
jgi:glutaredoxin